MTTQFDKFMKTQRPHGYTGCHPWWYEFGMSKAFTAGIQSVYVASGIEPIYQIASNNNGFWKDINEAQYNAYKDRGMFRKLFTSPSLPKAYELDELKAELSRMRQVAMAYKDTRDMVIREKVDLQKAEYDADGNPLNLMAAAKDLEALLKIAVMIKLPGHESAGKFGRSMDNLRKFIDVPTVKEEII